MMEEEKRYVEEAETQYNEWKGTAALDDPQLGTADDVFGLDPERFGHAVAFSIHGGSEAGVGLSMNATVYVLDPSLEGERAEELTDANGEVPVVRIYGVKATAEDVLSKFKRFKIEARPHWMVDRGIRLRIERTVDLGEEKEDERQRQEDDEPSS
jgi:hypothetical protein